MASILLADSGSTKTDWCLISKNGQPRHLQTKGLNPFFTSENECRHLLETEVQPFVADTPLQSIIFYGAGVKDEGKAAFLRRLLGAYLSSPDLEVHSDLLAAARATCDGDPGLTCILGTGSNSGYFDGRQLKIQNPSLGYIIGDEGSGTYLGKRVLQYFFYRTFDEDLSDAFQNKYGNDLTAILDKVYNQPFGNRYLASFTQFLIEQRGHYMVENIIEDAFIDFHQRHILKYRQSWQHPVHFCGTVAYEFRDILIELQSQYGLQTGQIVKSPREGLIAFHSRQL